MNSKFDEKDFLACCGSKKFAEEMASSGPFANLDQAVDAARDIWFNKVSFSLTVFPFFFSLFKRILVD